jgi:LacI family transcriptional regulator
VSVVYVSHARLKDIARRAKVSVATASLALNGKGRISDAVRTKVRDTADLLGYRARRPPSPHPGAVDSVGILHAEDREYEWHFIRPTILELEHALRHKGHLPVLIPAGTHEEPEKVLRHVLDSGVKAVFALQMSNGALFSDLLARGIRLVVINNSGFQTRFHSVCVDDFQGAYEGTLFLLSLGHRCLAFVEYARPDTPNVVADRFIGFRKALEEQKVGFSPEQRLTVPFMDPRKLVKKLAALFSRSEKPTAIFAHDDYLGLYVIDALGKLGLSVPGDVSLVAPGDVLDYTLPLMPQITTMRIDTALLGKIAANLMFDRMRNTDSDVHVLKVKEQLVRRASCREV